VLQLRYENELLRISKRPWWKRFYREGS
jgi:hypothetical protein